MNNNELTEISSNRTIPFLKVTCPVPDIGPTSLSLEKGNRMVLLFSLNLCKIESTFPFSNKKPDRSGFPKFFWNDTINNIHNHKASTFGKAMFVLLKAARNICVLLRLFCSSFFPRGRR